MEQESYDIIELGKEVEAFIGSKIGRMIIEKAENDRARAMRALGEADPTDAKLISKIQQDYNTPNKVLMWLLSAKEEGISKQLEEEVMEEANEEPPQQN